MWLTHLEEALPDLGHRNWIVVADAAFPELAAPGIVTLNSGEPLIPVLIQVMALLKAAPHVRPDVLLDQEWFELNDQECPGISRLRLEAAPLFAGLKTEGIWHEDLLTMLAKTSSEFTVFMIKTTSAIPYTSVFLRLECGYWTGGQERAFRQRLSEESR